MDRACSGDRIYRTDSSNSQAFGLSKTNAMKVAVFILGALVATALGDEPANFNMPNMDMLGALTGGQIPQLPPGMSLDDVKDAFQNMPPAMKERLSDMAEGFGMKLGDVEEALNNPPENLKKYFENNAQNGDGSVPTGKPSMGGLDLSSLLSNVDMGSIAGMMKGMDIGSMMEGMDMGMMGDMLKNVDVGSMMKGMDMGMIGNMMKNVDIGSLMQGMDMGMVGDLMKNMDMGMVGDLMKNMDMGMVGGMMKNVDLGAITGMMKNMDIGSVGNMMKGMDLHAIGDMAKNVDIGYISQVVGEKMPRSLADVKRIIGVPEDASLGDMKEELKAKLEAMGVPIDDPKAMIEYASDTMKALNIPMPEGVDLTDLMGTLNRQMEAIGIPTEPEKIKDFVMAHFGLNGMKLEDLKNPSVIVDIIKRKVFNSFGINEDEDPMTVRNRVKEQLFEEIQKLGVNVNKDSTIDDMKQEMDKMVAKEINNMRTGVEQMMTMSLTGMGLDVETLTPQSIHAAAKSKLAAMGVPVDDVHALKRHVMHMLKRQLMSTVTPMIINMFMPHRPHPQPSPVMPQQQQMIPLNLDIEVNVQQPESTMSAPYMPRYLQGAESALDHPIEYMDDGEVFDHIFSVRQALMTGEMNDDAIQEMLEDLMEARLKIRVLSVRNMFLRDRLAAQTLPRRGPAPMMHPTLPRQPLPRQPIRQAPTLLRALRGERVV